LNQEIKPVSAAEKLEPFARLSVFHAPKIPEPVVAGQNLGVQFSDR
jgi:hypothetical protein